MDEESLQNQNRSESAREEIAFAEQMRSALQRVDAPDGFTDRLMARVEIRKTALTESPSDLVKRRGVLLQFTRPAWRVAYAAAAMLAITTGAVRVEHARTEQRRSDQATAQFDAALQVTHHALDHVSAKLETTEFGNVQRALETDGGSK